jgi:hypothetical protein
MSHTQSGADKGLADGPHRVSMLHRMTGQDDAETVGMRVVFWLWMVTIVVGLTVMIVIPLTGR